MAGVRAVEEILARGGAEQFDITVFGDEPYGNYNRILLSNVLAGSDDPAEIYLNALDWYADNDIDLRAGVRVVRIDRFAHLVHADDGTTHALRQADPGHRQPVVLPADGRAVGRRHDPDRRGLRLPHASTTRAAMIAEAANRDQGRGDRRRPARPGGRPRPAEPRPDRRRRARRPDADERAARRRRPARSCARSVESLGIGVHTDKRTTEVILTRRHGCRASRSPTASDSTATCSWSPPASGPTSAWRSAPG